MFDHHELGRVIENAIANKQFASQKAFLASEDLRNAVREYFNQHFAVVRGAHVVPVDPLAAAKVDPMRVAACRRDCPKILVPYNCSSNNGRYTSSVNAFDIWLSDPERRTASGTCCHPPGAAWPIGDQLNTWMGRAVELDEARAAEDHPIADWFFDEMLPALSEDDDALTHGINLLAANYVFPGRKLQSALCIKNPTGGVGKSTIYKVQQLLLGRRYSAGIQNVDQLNQYAANLLGQACITCLDEVRASPSQFRAYSEILKRLITENNISGRGIYSAYNTEGVFLMGLIILITNDDRMLGNPRRQCMWATREALQEPPEDFAEKCRRCQEDPAVLRAIAKRFIQIADNLPDGWTGANPPKTVFVRENATYSWSPVQTFWAATLTSRQLRRSRNDSHGQILWYDGGESAGPISLSQIYEGYLSSPGTNEHMDVSAFSRLLMSCSGLKTRRQGRTQQRMIDLPPYTEALQFFRDKIHMPHFLGDDEDDVDDQ